MATIAVAGGCSGSLRAAVRARRRRRTGTTTAVAGTGAVAVAATASNLPLAPEWAQPSSARGLHDGVLLRISCPTRH